MGHRIWTRVSCRSNCHRFCSAPRQLKRDVHTAPRIRTALVGLQTNARAGRIRYDCNKLLTILERLALRYVHRVGFFLGSRSLLAPQLTLTPGPGTRSGARAGFVQWCTAEWIAENGSIRRLFTISVQKQGVKELKSCTEHGRRHVLRRVNIEGFESTAEICAHIMCYGANPAVFTI